MTNDRDAVSRLVESFLLEEISGAGFDEPFAPMERDRLATLLATQPDAIDGALDAISSVIRTLAEALSHSQRQAALRTVRDVFEGRQLGEPPDSTEQN